ncbi:phage minor head protein [Mycoavidus sp. HKI]|uniref:phage head morphogenesis protein n=1 Tax=Mycoavidus sp. HKI TaxID=2840467 RepID=UPI001CBDEF0E|nr:phage minor head protein [Mycoavidus sp. HKI]UAW63476.1 phage minor head protein [Mycoavidus sp. HKI]
MMMARKLLPRKKSVRANPFQPILLRGQPLRVSAGLQARYQQELDALVTTMTASTYKELVALFLSPSAQEFFAQDAGISSQARLLTKALTRHIRKHFTLRAKQLVKHMMTEADKVSSASVSNSLRELSGGVSLKTNAIPPSYQAILESSVTENVNLIKSIATRYLDKVKEAAMRSITSGNGLEDLIPFLQAQEGTTRRRARNIALDQTRKAYNGFNRARCVGAGVTHGEWIHSGGGLHPREKHQDFSGHVFDLTQGAPIGPNDTYVQPGEEPNCKCAFAPILQFTGGSA